MLSKNTEALKSMHSQTAKFAKWYVKILDPKVGDYSFFSKGEAIHAQGTRYNAYTAPIKATTTSFLLYLHK